MTPGVLPAWDPYCGQAPDQNEWLSRWNLDPVVIVVIAGLALALWRVANNRSERSCVAVGTFIALLIFVSPLCALSSALFAVRVGHHVVLTAILAPLLVAAVRRGPFIVSGTLPLWTLAQAAIFWAWHAPPLYSAALSNHFLYWLMQMSLLGSSFGFWSAVRRSPPPQAVAALLATTLQMGLLGAIITFAAVPLYAPHWTTTMSWGLTPLEDQQLAGLIMWAPAAGLYLAAALVLTNKWLAGETSPAPA